MITLFDDWVIIPEQYCYGVAKRNGKTKDKKTGEEVPVYRYYGYYSTLGGALKGFKKILQSQALIGVDVDLDGAIEIIHDCNNIVSNLIDKVVGE